MEPEDFKCQSKAPDSLRPSSQLSMANRIQGAKDRGRRSRRGGDLKSLSLPRVTCTQGFQLSLQCFRFIKLMLPRPPPLPAVPSFPRASREAVLLSPPSEAPGLQSLRVTRIRHSLPSWGLALLPFRGIRFSATESFATPSALRRSSPVTGYPCPSPVVNIPPNALRRVVLDGTPLPQGRMGKAG